MAAGAPPHSAAPAVSILTPAYDVARFVGAAVDSALAQTSPDWEMVVVDDGSVDGTAAVVAARKDPRIRLIRQANAGVSAARSRAVEAARGRAVLFLDADDWLAPDALDRLSAALAAAPPDAVGAYGAYAFVAEDAKPGDPPLRRKSGPFPAGDILERLVVQNLFANGGHLLLRREAVDRAGPFLSHVRYGEDWEYWIRLALQGPFAVVPGAEPLLFVRQRTGSAYNRMARDPAAFRPAMDAIFNNPALRERLGAERAEYLHRRAEAENAWIAGRELIRHGQRGPGLEKLRASVAAAPSPKRVLLLAAAHALPVLPRRLHGPFTAYPA
ncbi:glycosyltransferase [Craurococcus roseus]|uniref:Glycosyltransferase n=1 Tax=Craurococcus roseus TaxID=77585 RepID=A0ABN1F524_9PROT